MPKPVASPTSSQFQAYEQMFAYFNAKLFAGWLPPVLLNFSRRAKSLGFFAPERWEKGKSVRHEISLNPTHLKSQKPVDVASTLRTSNILVATLGMLDRRAEATAVAERALALGTNAFGPNDVRLSDTLIALAAVADRVIARFRATRSTLPSEGPAE